ncbi:hypothetical protein VTN96DRAFT_2157 [Rasamsonia emersonii]
MARIRGSVHGERGRDRPGGMTASSATNAAHAGMRIKSQAVWPGSAGASPNRLSRGQGPAVSVRLSGESTAAGDPGPGLRQRDQTRYISGFCSPHTAQASLLRMLSDDSSSTARSAILLPLFTICTPVSRRPWLRGSSSRRAAVRAGVPGT